MEHPQWYIIQLKTNQMKTLTKWYDFQNILLNKKIYQGAKESMGGIDIWYGC